MKWVYAYGAAGGVFLILDALWLSLVVPGLYRPALGEILSDRVNFLAAGAFYLLYIGGILILAVYPGVKAQSLAMTCLAGAVLGLVAYGTYDLTNLATLKVWSLKVALIDMAWGSFLTAAAAGAAHVLLTGLVRN